MYTLNIRERMIDFFQHFFEYSRQFRLKWGVDFLSKPVSCCLTNANNEVMEGNALFSLKSRLLTGWYMLEIQVKLSVPQAKSYVYFDNFKDNYSKSLALPLYSDRLCKRLIYLPTSGRLRLELPLLHVGQLQLLHFKLVRVSEKFAQSRMLRKLLKSHPRYKQNLYFSYQKENSSISLKPVELMSLWEDYCALFEDANKLVTYSEWICKFDLSSDDARASMRSHIELFERKPLISILMPVYNPSIVWLEQAIESIRSQIYPNWELSIADDASTDPEIRSILKRYVQEDSRIKVVFREQNGHISAASNSALTLAKGDWVALLDHDDLLSEHALYWVVDAINNYPDSRLIYSDEDKIDEHGFRSDPYFKCDWNLDLFYSQNMFSHLGIYYTELVREVGGFRIGFEGSQDYDLALRCIEKIDQKQIHHISRVLYHWRMHADSTALSNNNKPYAMIAGERALNEHLSRQSVNATAESTAFGYRVRYVLPTNLPLVSLIILTRNGLNLLRKCIESILRKTTYSNYEILIIDNGSDDSATLRYLLELVSEPRIQIIRDERPFNYSALNNDAVKLAQGEIIGLINNDIEVIDPEWLSEMVSHAVRPEVGAVGARLWYTDDTLQHAGVVLGLRGVAEHVHRYLRKDDPGYFGRAALIQSFSVVTAACLVIRKSIYETLGGLNEKELQVAFNDVDFCLRVREAGYRNIWTPYAELYHHESATRGFDETPEKKVRLAKEVAYMQQRWGNVLENDPAYSPNLSLDNKDFTLAWPPRVDPFNSKH